MPALLLISLFLLVLFDARLLRERDPECYQQLFDAAPERWAFYTSFLFVVMLPVYLLRRKQFQKSKQDRVGPSLDDPATQGKHLVHDAVGLILLWFCIELFAVIIIYGVASLLPGFGSELSRVVLVSVFSSVLVVGLIYRITRNYPQGFWGSTGFRPEYGKASLLKTFFIPFVLGLGFAFFSATLLMVRQTQPDTPLNDLIESAHSMRAVFAFLMMALFLAPLLEEIIFRGYFFGVLRRYKGEGVAILAVAASFGILHYDQYWGDWLAIALVTLLGFALTLLRSWSGTTIASIVAHYTYNFCVTIIPIVTLMVSNPHYVQYVFSYDSMPAAEKEILLKQSIEKDSKLTEAYNDLAWLYAGENRNLDEALVLIDKALQLEPDNAAYLDTKAEILYRMGRVAEAIDIERRLTEEHPGDSFYKQQLEKFEEARQPEHLT